MYVMTAGVQRGDKRDPAVRVWDLATGVAVRAYRGGVVAPSGLAVTSAGLMLAAQKGKPAIHAWQLHAEPMHIRIPLSEGCTSLTCTADGATCVAGTASGRMCTWDVATGDLLSVVPTAHYRAVTVLRFSDDGGRLISASDDGTAKVWETRLLVDRSGHAGGAITPVCTWAEHTLPVTGVHCGYGGLQARVLTVSKDCSCKVWELATGELAGTLSLPSDLWSVTADAAEQYVYCGAGDGTVYALALFRVSELSPRTATLIRASDVLRFVGHTEPVTSVAVTVDMATLVSGSEDGTARVWDTESRQCLRVLGHKEPVTAMCIVPKHWIDRAVESTTAPISPFSRQQAPANGNGVREFRRGTLLRISAGGRRVDRVDATAWPAHTAAVATASADGSTIADAEDQVRAERDRLAAEVQQWRTAAGALYAHATRTAGL